MVLTSKIKLKSVLVGDELGQIKLVQFSSTHSTLVGDEQNNCDDILAATEERIYGSRNKSKNTRPLSIPNSSQSLESGSHSSSGRSSITTLTTEPKNKIVRVLDQCLQREPALSRAITSIRSVDGCHESHLDTTDRANNIFVISNRLGQLFLCDTNAIMKEFEACQNLDTIVANHDSDISNAQKDTDEKDETNNMISPIYYDINNQVPVVGAQPVNQTNILVIYKNGDIQHINISQDILLSTLRIRRKAIRMLGLAYNSDAKAIHWRIDGVSGLCYYSSDSTTGQLNDSDPLTDMVIDHPIDVSDSNNAQLISRANPFDKPPSVKSRQCNERARLVPTQVINMISSRAHQIERKTRIGKWSSITSLNLIYRKLALYDLVGTDKLSGNQNSSYNVITFKLNENRLAVGGHGYAARVYDVQTQKPIYNLITGASKRPLTCPRQGEDVMVGDLDWLGGNKAIKKLPDMLVCCSAVDSVVRVYDLRSPRPVYHIDLTDDTENRWKVYENQHLGAIFTRLCTSAAPNSTAVPSQQVVLGSTNGQLHLIDLRFLAKSKRHLGRMSGFCGGQIRDLHYVSESHETSKVLSCSDDRFMRIHRIQTAYTSFLSQRLVGKIFLGTKPTCLQPVCIEEPLSLNPNLLTRSESNTYLSTNTGGSSLF